MIRNIMRKLRIHARRKTRLAIPPIPTILPRQARQPCKRRNQVEQSPGNNNAVVNIQKEDNGHGSITDTLQDRHELPDERHPARAQILTNSYFLQEDRNPAENHGNPISH